VTVTTATISFGAWTPGERVRLSAILTAVGALHVVGWTRYLTYSGRIGAAGGFAGAGTLAYALEVRHAFDADHIAAIDDTTRLMMQRGRRPVSVGFFFALGHSAVVLLLAVVVAFAGRSPARRLYYNLTTTAPTVAVFAVVWGAAALPWRFGGLEERYG
jgi:nickel/cobalt transporter (NiCoT) family protein